MVAILFRGDELGPFSIYGWKRSQWEETSNIYDLLNVSANEISRYIYNLFSSATSFLIGLGIAQSYKEKSH